MYATLSVHAGTTRGTRIQAAGACSGSGKSGIPPKGSSVRWNHGYGFSSVDETQACVTQVKMVFVGYDLACRPVMAYLARP